VAVILNVGPEPPVGVNRMAPSPTLEAAGPKVGDLKTMTGLEEELGGVAAAICSLLLFAPAILAVAGVEGVAGDENLKLMIAA